MNRLYYKFMRDVEELGSEIYNFAMPEEKKELDIYMAEGHSEVELAEYVYYNMPKIYDEMPELKARIIEYVKQNW